MNVQTFIKSYKNIILLGLATIGIFAFLVSKLVPIASHTFQIRKDYKNAQTTLADKEKYLTELQEKAKEAEKAEKIPLKPFFRAIDKGMDTESIIANEFGEVINILRSNSIKARYVSYDYDPQDDSFVQNSGGKYSVARLTIEMIGTYKNYEGFLRDLFKHEHFIDIVNFEIWPYEKNKRILIIKMQLKLYAQKD